MIKIAFIIDTIATEAAGTEKQLMMLLDGLDHSKFQPHLICLRDSPWLQSHSISVPCTTFKLTRLLRYQSLRFIRKFRKLHQNERFNIVQTFFVDANIIGTIAAHLAGCPVIISSRRNAGHWHNWQQVIILRSLRRWTSRYLANSHAAAKLTQEVEGVAGNKIEVIPNGLELSEFTDIDESKREQQRNEWSIDRSQIVIGTVANLRPVKNIESLIKAATIVTEKYSQARFVVVGEGELRKKLQAEIDRRHLTGKFKLVGRQNRVINCLAAFDIGVLCSHHESLSNSLIEYLAAGLPTIASDVGGNGEIVSHQRTGLLYESNNVNALADCINSLIENQSIANRLATKARQEAHHRFDWSQVLDRYEQFYTKISGMETALSEKY